MSLKIKNHICKKVINHFSKFGTSDKHLTALVPDVCVGRQLENQVEFHLPCTSVLKHVKNLAYQNIIEQASNFSCDDTISSVSSSNHKGNQKLIFTVRSDLFIKSTVEGLIGRQSPASNGQSVVFDFSSPNIAKPFHMGHLRSTVIGNFLANLHEWFGFHVVRLNYLGDWGTQYGLVKIGMSMLDHSPHEMSKKPLETLFQAYVLANKAAEKDPNILENARKYFSCLERGEVNDMSDWESYRSCTISDLKKTYKRLGIIFTDYAWESDYRASNLRPLIKNLESKGLISVDEEGRTVSNLPDGERVPVLKSDGTTLYLMRDVAAALDRHSKYQFDKMFYIVDSSQEAHFKKLFSILNRLQVPWAENLEHVSFGRVRGMSTRKGQVTFLSDILDESQTVMIDRQILSPNTRVHGADSSDVSDILGVSAVIMADLKHSRQKAYTFNWNDAVNPKGDTGVRLQYTHCRLCSLKDKSNFSPATVCDPDALREMVAIQLVYEISRFDDVLKKSYETFEASVLSAYLFQLCTVINRALIQLQVKGQEDLGPQRLFLFEEARLVLHQGMLILGVQPLSKM